jgi:dTMP kinase
MNFIAIEGLDGAGKSTEVELVRRHLQARGICCQYLHFPRAGTEIWGELVSKFLRGDFGKIDEVNPYLVALIYAEDRHAAAPQIGAWLKEGSFVIVDRYVYSNVAFQCAKVADPAERRQLREWILQLEYSYFKIPQPQLSLFLDVPFSFTQKRLAEQRTGNDRQYLEGKQDIHEANLNFQQAVREEYLSQLPLDADFRLISCCTEQGAMHTPEYIFEQIKQHLQ